jgi:hypothetical protein
VSDEVSGARRDKSNTERFFKVIVFGPKLTLSLTHSLNTWSVGYIPVHVHTMYL